MSNLSSAQANEAKLQGRIMLMLQRASARSKDLKRQHCRPKYTNFASISHCSPEL